jgi:hypothetical protein
MSDDLNRRKQEHERGDGSPFVLDAIRSGSTVLYRYLVAREFEDHFRMEANHMRAYMDKHNQMKPPGNVQNVSLPSWWASIIRLMRYMAE